MIYAVGLMSGTSLDGVDACLVAIDGASVDTSLSLLHFATFPYTEELKRKIRLASEIATSNVATICALNFELGQVYSKAVEDLCALAHFNPRDLRFVANHGQTIHHQPIGLTPSTLQIGESSIIAYDHHVDVIDNFRVMDIAAKGQGAPLVPFSEIVLYTHPTKHRILLNIGGISNITYLPAQARFDQVEAFDVGPGNMIIDALMRHFFGVNFDDQGKVAARGQVDERVLRYCMSHPFFTKPHPKSCGREQFGDPFVQELLSQFQEVSPHDLVASVCAFTVEAIASQIEMFYGEHPLDEIVVAGGGAHNLTMLNGLRAACKRATVLTQEALGFSSDAKEAIAFALLGNQTLHRQFSNIKSATGAQCDVILGKITLNPHGERYEKEEHH